MLVVEFELGYDDAETFVTFVDPVDTRDSFDNFKTSSNKMDANSQSYEGIEYKEILVYQKRKGDARRCGLFFENVNGTGFNLIVLE